MPQDLTSEDAALWARVTKGIRPLGSSPVSSCEGQEYFEVPTPRSVAYNPRMDLHGATIHEAFGMVNEHIYQGTQNGYKKLLIITGKSGQINLELPRWLERNPSVRSVKQLANGGSWEIAIRAT